MTRASDALIDNLEDAGLLTNSVISAVACKGFVVQTTDGQPATLAVVDSTGHVIEFGPHVLDGAWIVAVLAYRRFLEGRGALEVMASPRDGVQVLRRAGRDHR